MKLIYNIYMFLGMVLTCATPSLALTPTSAAAISASLAATTFGICSKLPPISQGDFVERLESDTTYKNLGYKRVRQRAQREWEYNPHSYGGQYVTRTYITWQQNIPDHPKTVLRNGIMAATVGLSSYALMYFFNRQIVLDRSYTILVNTLKSIPLLDKFNLVSFDANSDLLKDTDTLTQVLSQEQAVTQLLEQPNDKFSLHHALPKYIGLHKQLLSLERTLYWLTYRISPKNKLYEKLVKLNDGFARAHHALETIIKTISNSEAYKKEKELWNNMSFFQKSYHALASAMPKMPSLYPAPKAEPKKL